MYQVFLLCCFVIMKVDIAIWRPNTAFKITGWWWWWVVAAALWGGRPALGSGPLGPSDQPEAYFNGSSYIRLTRPISLKQLVGLSYRTCVGGELFSQRFEQYTLHVTALFEQVVVSWARPGKGRREVGLAKETLDNHWHWVALRYRPNPPSLILELDRDTQVVSNVTWNPELLSPGALEAGGAVVLVGSVFSGCLLEGPQLEFHVNIAQTRNVLFGHCPLATDHCKDKKDVLRIPPKDHCYNEPCMRHGTCISRPDKYECHCTARYTGNNCEVDAGDPCASAPCRHGARCQEDTRGDYVCVCPPHYHGTWCELEMSLDPLCVAGPCRNNGSCAVPPGAPTYVCACPPGYTGRNCETDVDECAGATVACLNGGRCVDAVNNYTCDCSNTGYTGARCEVNVNECEEDHSVCGHGLCYDTYGSFVCACLPGYTGERCHRMSACASGPCGPGGACVEEGGGGGFRCVCARGWEPPLCLVPFAPPAPAPQPAPLPAPPAACADMLCPHHSHCYDPYTPGLPTMVTGVLLTKQVSCVCDVGYYGAPGLSPNCSSLEAACEAGVCLNGATCSVSQDQLNCTCAPGYKGEYCESPATSGAGAGGGAGAGKALSELKAPPAPAPEPERCAAAPCVHAASCLDTTTGFRCECESGWGGVRCDVPSGSAGGPEPCARSCLNGGTCREGDAGPLCDCRDGYSGPLCELALDCRAAGCPPHQECVEGGGGGWQCGAASAQSACASAPCHNGTCLALDDGLFRCQCPPGNTGRLCEVDVDECTLKPKICNHGVCMNVPGSYQCYCKPGYTGDSCDQDIDECLSSPCKNGGSCQNLQNNYECSCVEGFDGKDCSINVDDCEGSPCAAGATCLDGVASFRCLCPEGLTGSKCEIDIDDCESAPCQHGGACVDGLNSYTCECAGTGYTGPECGVNIDDCAPQPCRRGGTCLDLVNDYRCTCHPGYTGKNCEVDINECESEPCKFGGVCLELSNASLYREPGAPPERVGTQPHMLLPPVFYQPFSLENASGFVCVCVEGTVGARCEVNVDECASSPCAHGKCIDGVGRYSCECAPGYEGARCELDVDECERYRPCANGRCYDGQATYFCECEAGYGGQNCSVVLEGCRDAPCRNHGTCLPWLQHETEHRFNCSCAPGHHGTTCEKITTMSLEKSSYVEVNTTREEGYEISFRFKTTLGSGLLAMGRGLTYFFLELSNGRLNLHSSLLNKWEGVFIGSNLNDSNWQKVFVAINASHLVLAANEEQTIYPISQNEAYNSSVTSFPSTRLGTAGSSYATLTHGPNFFVGCFQDVVVNRQWVLPEDSSSNSTSVSEGGEEAGSEEGGERVRAQLVGVLASCPRKPQCAPSPCHSGGACEDHWTSFLCTCPRPHLGDTCQYNYTAATFGHEGSVGRGVVAVRVSDAARLAVHAALDVSMFIRTRKPTGHIFYLGSAKYWQPEATVVGASLKGGELLLHLRFNQTPEDYTVGGTRLDNGHLHLIEVVRNSTLVQVKLNGTEYFRKSISAAKQLDAQMLYLGGPPPSPAPAPLAEAGLAVDPSPAPPGPATVLPLAPTTTSAPAPALTTLPPPQLIEHSDADYFKGVIQDVQVSNGVNVSIVEFFPLQAKGLRLPPPFGEVFLDPAAVLPGVVSDDACASHPCQHDATCTVTWNDYMCTCPQGYKGKQCAEVEFCQLQSCPVNSHCRNLDVGYECVSNATFEGASTTLSYQLRRSTDPALATPGDTELPDSLTITFRSKVGGTMFMAQSGEWLSSSQWWFSVGVYRGAANVQWRLPGDTLPQLHRLPARPHTPPTNWTTLKMYFAQGLVKAAWVEAEGHEEVVWNEKINVEGWQRLVQDGYIQLGGVRQAPPTTLPSPADLMDNSTEAALWEATEADESADDNVAGRYFKGCMGGVWVGSRLLPYFTEAELFVGIAASLLAGQPHYALLSGRPWEWSSNVGCVLCLERDCLRGGRCADVRTSYACDCPQGYAGDYCEIDVDECVGHECQHGATCQDGVAAYSCLCPQGFDGRLCEVDIDECEVGPCGNGGTCVDESGGFRCECGPGWHGPTCALPRSRSCRHRPCAEGRAACIDMPTDPVTGNNYTCKCFEGFEGAHCETAFCEREPCRHGHCATDQQRAVCECEPGWEGARCERDVDDCAPPAPGATACQHGGTCRDQPNGFLCECTPGWTGAYCEVDVDECAGLVSCLPGECRNTEGGYTCICAAGLCGHNCVLDDPCAAQSEGSNATGPCLHGGLCEQRCAAEVDYECLCVDGWGGKNCSQQILSEGSEGVGGSSSTVLIAVGAALLGLALAGAALGALGVQARRKRATRGTYSPSGQEYCNPRAEMMHNALKPPPEERLI